MLVWTLKVTLLIFVLLELPGSMIISVCIFVLNLSKDSIPIVDLNCSSNWYPHWFQLRRFDLYLKQQAQCYCGRTVFGIGWKPDATLLE